MKPHPRIRKTIKWGGAAVTVFFVAVWIWSYWGHLELHHSLRVIVTLQDGKFHVASWSEEWIRTQGASGSQSWGGIPVAFPVSVFLFLTAAAWHLDILASNRERIGLCPKCNYDRAGIAKDAVCPECGSKGGPA